MGVAGRRRVAMRLHCNTFYNFLMFTNYVCICFHVVETNNYLYLYHYPSSRSDCIGQLVTASKRTSSLVNINAMPTGHFRDAIVDG